MSILSPTTPRQLLSTRNRGCLFNPSQTRTGPNHPIPVQHLRRQARLLLQNKAPMLAASWLVKSRSILEGGGCPVKLGRGSTAEIVKVCTHINRLRDVIYVTR